jgi:hypothetical protein
MAPSIVKHILRVRLWFGGWSDYRQRVGSSLSCLYFHFLRGGSSLVNTSRQQGIVQCVLM